MHLRACRRFSGGEWRRQPFKGGYCRVRLGLKQIEQALHFAFGEMRELARTGFREVHAVHRAQLDDHAVHVRPERIIEAARIAERLPDIDKACILFGEAFANDFVDLAVVGGQPLAFRDRQAHPEQWNSLLPEGLGDFFDAIAVNFLPFVRERLVAVVAIANGLAVIAADHHDCHVHLLVRGKQVVHGFRPVVDLVCDKAGIPFGLAHDRDLRAVDVSFLQSLREQLPKAVAEHVDDERCFRRGFIRNRRSRLVRHSRRSAREGKHGGE